MAIDPKRVKEIFLEAAELSDEAARAAYLDRACGADAGVRGRVEALLRSHDPEGSFLGTPAAVVPDPDHGATQALTGIPVPSVAAAQTTDGENGASDDEALTFLAPPTREGALGRLGHYEVLQVLGRGGFGIVFRAFDERLQRVVALKVMAPQLAATSPARKRFLREARSSAQVRHENVVQVYEVAEQPLPYLAMEFIPGETLQQLLDRVGPLDVPEVLRIGRQIAEGLAAAHATDLIHRDIKPGNILLEGGQHKVKITDFGLARAADDASISQSGVIAGTPMYMAPEQAQGQPLDQRADLFSLGSVLYQMVAGRPPFRASTAVAVLKRVAEDRPRAIREIIPETPQWLCDIIARLHAKDPDDRYQSAREVADVLADCEAQLKVNAKLKDYSLIPRSKPQRSGRRKWVAAAAAVLLPVIAFAVADFAGLTHLFRGQVETNDETDGWVQLFNGKDLSGWKKHPIKPGFWRVDENGHLVGAGPVDYAFLSTVRDDFEDFHLRVEAMVDTPESDSGVFFRVPVLEEGSDFAEINISSDPARPGEQTGSLFVHIAGKDAWYPAATGLTKPKEWSILEIIARGDHVVTKVNGKLALDTEVPTPNRRGHIFLQQAGGKTIVRFRKIEIKDLPPAGVRTESGVTDKPALTAIAPFTDADVQRIAALPAAEQVEEVRKELKRRNPGLDGIMEHKIEGGVVTELRIVSDKVADIGPIRVFDALRVLHCSATWTNDGPNGLLADLTPLKGMNLAALTHLNLANMKVGDAGMGYFKDCKNLTHLDLFYTPVSDAGLVHFKDCKNLTHLYLGRTKLSDAGLANFRDCKNLTDLWVHDVQVGDAGMDHFHDCKALKSLNLAKTKVSDVGLAHFKDCQNLKGLYVDGTQVGDAGLAQLKGMPLRELSINNTGITDLTPLQGMPLEHIRLTPKNITKGLDILRDMKSLETIGIAWRQAWPAAEFWQRYDKGEFKG